MNPNSTLAHRCSCTFWGRYILRTYNMYRLNILNWFLLFSGVIHAKLQMICHLIFRRMEGENRADCQSLSWCNLQIRRDLGHALYKLRTIAAKHYLMVSLSSPLLHHSHASYDLMTYTFTSDSDRCHFCLTNCSLYINELKKLIHSVPSDILVGCEHP